MKNILISVTIGLLGAMFLASFTAHGAVTTWLISESIDYQITRLAVIGLLFGLLFSRPPRQLWFRLLIGAGGICLALSSLMLIMDYQMHILDMAMFIEVSIILSIEALENAVVTTGENKKVPES